MALVNCRECNNEISEKAFLCPHCGVATGRGMFGYEYRSRAKLFGLPVAHIVFGFAINPMTGRLRVAKGIIAIGPIAIGLVAIGGWAVGGICLGGVAFGLASLGGCAIGLLLAVGGAAVGLVAIGGLAVGYYALGGGAYGAHALGANAQDPEAVDFFKRYLGDWVERLQNAPRR